jgi:hypothetical protein
LDDITPGTTEDPHGSNNSADRPAHLEAHVDICEVDNEGSHSFQLIISSDKLLLCTPSGFGTNVTYRIIDVMKIPPDACRKIKGEPTASSRTFEKELLDFGTKTFFFRLGKSDKDDDTKFVNSLAHRDMKLTFIGNLYFRSKIQTSLEDKLFEVQSNLQLPLQTSTKSFFCPISFAHVPLQQFPAPQAILLLHVNITIHQVLLPCRQLRYVFRESPNLSCCTVVKYSLTYFVLQFHKLGLLVLKAERKTILYWILGLQKLEAPRISEQLVHEGVKFVSPTDRPPLPPGDTRGTHFLEESTAVA